MDYLSLEHIGIQFTDRPLLVDESLFVADTDRIGIIGVNGAGKTTLLRIMAGRQAPDSGRVSRAGGATLSFLDQSPEFPGHLSVIEQVFHHASPEMREQKEFEAKNMLTRLGIDDFEADVATLSGGQRKRIAIAAALIRPCDILLLDEPTNHIDAEAVAYLEQYLTRRRGALVMVTHDRYFLERICNRIVEVDEGHLYQYEANYSKYLAEREARNQMQAASQRKLRALLKTELAWLRQGAQARTTKARFRVERYDQLEAQLDTARPGQLTLGAASARLGRKLIELNGVSKRYGDRTLIDSFDYRLLRDDRIGVIGPNGAGKTTLLRLIAGLTEPDEGTIERGETVRIGFFSQESGSFDPDERVIDAVKRVSNAIETPDGTVTATQMLDRFLFEGWQQYEPVGKLSGGERRRLQLLQVLMDAPNVLLLDEPTNDLDIHTLTLLEDYIATFPGPVVAVSHDRYFLDKVAGRIFAVLGDGTIRDTVGGYADYRAAEDERREIEAPREKKDAPQRGSGERKRKFSFKEQREFESIEGEIAGLESDKAKLSEQIDAAASDYVALQALLAQKEAAEAHLAGRYDRWAELSELSELIEGEK